ncbi:selenide, water dikinase SelD [Coleofasciculus sp. FACHB-SPT36]|uniref:selenide, water dikinase SelD n=1 Tax=Cyanophyceae TaxID=3028117 RepID=UPI00168BED55|nr:selenide, water dikinase SelD [Coleofasciculus sp. FACHB-SPT36]MBD2541898.1 selenide, water dikinase SelD [Coleofasciculus sp. FACHB-SPT36]
MQVISPIVKDLVLIGGGHSHAIVLKMLGMKPLPGVRLTLITDTSHTPYSGMLPGHVAGFYDYDESHIDLRRLAQFAQAQFYLDRAIGLDLENNEVICANHPDVAFDLLSIDIGSTPATISIPGAAEYAIPAKPVAKLLSEWDHLLKSVAETPEKPIQLSIVGGGAGGVELALAMQSRLHQFFEHSQQFPENLEIHLFHSGVELLPNYNPWVGRRLQKILIQRGVELHLGEKVCEVQPHKVICESGLVVECASEGTPAECRVFWVTQASAPRWLQASGLATDTKGFIQVDDTLRSLSHPQVFAAGDIATMIHHPRPKAGVFAVRQGKPLFNNLRRTLLGKPLQPYKPQKQYLSLIGTGDENAIASWGNFGCESRLFWHWKDRIDRQFMARFHNLPEMSAVTPSNIQNPKFKIQNPPMRCAGCGSKVGSTTLERVLHRIKLEHPEVGNREDILIGLDAPDDAAVVKVPADQVMVHTLDYFRSLINDPFIFAQISANHCLSDIFAMGATPQSALAIATIPYAWEEKQEETLYQLLSGAAKVLQQSQTPLVGGHTTEGAELTFGLSCNGLAYPNQLLRKGGMKPGQVLILTKALGTGTLFAAQMRLQAKGRWIDDAVHSMLLSNQAAAKCLLKHGVTACTDITGFGLLGHLLEMIQASQVAVEFNLEAIPVLEGALETLEMGIVSSLHPQNLRASRQISNLSIVSDRATYPLLFDPQTSGGLLAAIPDERADACVASLKTLGYTYSQIIGRVTPPNLGVQPISLIV